MVRHAREQEETSHQQDKPLTPSSSRPLTPNNTWLIDTNLRSPTPSLIAPVYKGACNCNNGITLVNPDHPIVLPGRVMRNALVSYISSQNRIVQDLPIHGQI